MNHEQSPWWPRQGDEGTLQASLGSAENAGRPCRARPIRTLAETQLVQRPVAERVDGLDRNEPGIVDESTGQVSSFSSTPKLDLPIPHCQNAGNADAVRIRVVICVLCMEPDEAASLRALLGTAGNYPLRDHLFPCRRIFERDASNAFAVIIRPDPHRPPPSPPTGGSITITTPPGCRTSVNHVGSHEIVRHCSAHRDIIEHGHRDAELLTLRHTKSSAYIGEHGESTLEVCCGSNRPRPHPALSGRSSARAARHTREAP